jgi:hypothetical protein
MQPQQAVNPQENVVEEPDPMTPCITPKCGAHRRYWHGDGQTSRCMRADCPCEGFTEQQE